MEEGISVIVCCFNSSLRIKPTLEHLHDQQQIPLSKWEIILVDNASTDNTSVIAEGIWNLFKSNKPAFKIVFEAKSGLSHARARGIKEAKYKFVVFCDDDNWLSDNYLHTALQIMNETSSLGVLGGRGHPIFEKKEPPYFWKNQYHVLAVGDQWHREGDITDERGVVYGAGMVLNKEAFNTLLEKYKFKFQVSDRIGDTLISSGDHELCLALRMIGYRIFYSKSLTFSHYIPENRISISYYKKLFLAFGISFADLNVYFKDKKKLGSKQYDYRYVCLRCCKNIVKTWFVLFISGYYIAENKYKYVGCLHHLYNNIGILKRTMVIKNSYKEIIRNNTLFSVPQK